MMKTAAVVLAAVLVALSVAGLAVAAAKQISGEVILVDPPSKTLTMKAQGAELTFSVEDKAVKSLTGLKPGDKVTVRYTEVDGKLTAQDIRKG